MEILDDIFAGWSFELCDKVDKNGFLRLLTILEETNLLKVNSISLSNKKIAANSLEQVFEAFMKSKNSKQDLLLEGFTMLEAADKKDNQEGVIYILYEPNLNLMSIDTYSDAWMPIGLYGDVSQIDSGIANDERLNVGLKQVSRLNFIKKVIPSEGEYFHDYSVHQIGFKMFYKCDIENIDGLEKKDYDKVAPFIISSNKNQP